MAKFLKRGALGIMTEAEGGASDPYLAEVRLTADEYEKIYRRITIAEKAAERVNEDAKRRVDEERADMKRRMAEFEKKAVDEAERRVRAAEVRREDEESMVAGLEAELDRQRNLNINLKRIARERANAMRGLKPKKGHSGYVVLSSEQYRQRYRMEHDYDEWRSEHPRASRKSFRAYEDFTADAWRTVLQTPYDASIPINQVRWDVMLEIAEMGFFSDIGIEAVQDEERNGEYFSHELEGMDGAMREACCLYRWSFKADYRTGLWEMVLYHTKSIRVPEKYRPAVMGAKSNGNGSSDRLDDDDGRLVFPGEKIDIEQWV